MTEQINRFQNTLSDNPVTATVAVGGSTVVGFMNQITPYLQVASLMIAITVGVLTIIGMIKRMKKNRNK